MPTIKLKAFTLLERVRTQSPVIHHLTNWVTIYDCAQVVKVLGASPVMAHAPEEVEEMVQLAGALVLNIGTLTVQVARGHEDCGPGRQRQGDSGGFGRLRGRGHLLSGPDVLRAVGRDQD